MKKYLTISFALLATALTLLTLPGCSTTADTTAYKSAAATQVTVDHAMRAWGDYVAQFHPPVAQEQAVKRALQTYQAAALALIDAEQAYSAAASSSTNGPPSTAGITAASQAASVALTDLINLITQLGVKLSP